MNQIELSMYLNKETQTSLHINDEIAQILEQIEVNQNENQE